MNHRIGTIQPETGFTQYYLSLTPGAWKTFNTEDNSFWCCTGTGVEEYAKLNDSIYWHDGEGIYVNLFIPSELNWAEKRVRLRQDTTFPSQPSTLLTFSVPRPTDLTLRLRVPAWVESAPSMTLNGKRVEASASPGSYLLLTRTWNNGDRLEMNMPMQLRVEAMPDNGAIQAFTYGLIVLAGNMGGEGLTKGMIIGPNAPRIKEPDVTPPALRAGSDDLSSWIKPGDQSLRFRTTNQRKDFSLEPLSSLFNTRYSVYWHVSS